MGNDDLRSGRDSFRVGPGGDPNSYFDGGPPGDGFYRDGGRDAFRVGPGGDPNSYFDRGPPGDGFYRDGGRGRGHNDLEEGLAGLAAGAILGGILETRRRGFADSEIPPAGGYAPGSPGYMRYCSMKFRSFDPVSFTFIGYDGRVRYCR